MEEHPSANLAANLVQIRRQRTWTQQQLSDRAGIPRSTVASMESGAGNPSLTNLARVAAALGTGIEELLARPRDACALVRAAQVPFEEKAGGRVRLHKLLPERVRGLEIDRLEMEPGASMTGTPHAAGTKEYLHCVAGRVQALVAGRAFMLEGGDVLAFPGDQRHAYRNPGGAPAVALSVVVPVPVGAVEA